MPFMNANENDFRVSVITTEERWNGGTVCRTPEGDKLVGTVLDMGDCNETFVLFPLIEQPDGLWNVDLNRSTNNIEWIRWESALHKFNPDWFSDRQPAPIRTPCWTYTEPSDPIIV